jgi:hypothetical protein
MNTCRLVAGEKQRTEVQLDQSITMKASLRSSDEVEMTRKVFSLILARGSLNEAPEILSEAAIYKGMKSPQLKC